MLFSLIIGFAIATDDPGLICEAAYKECKADPDTDVKQCLADAANCQQCGDLDKCIDDGHDADGCEARYPCEEPALTCDESYDVCMEDPLTDGATCKDERDNCRQCDGVENCVADGNDRAVCEAAHTCVEPSMTCEESHAVCLADPITGEETSCGDELANCQQCEHLENCIEGGGDDATCEARHPCMDEMTCEEAYQDCLADPVTQAVTCRNEFNNCHQCREVENCIEGCGDVDACEARHPCVEPSEDKEKELLRKTKGHRYRRGRLVRYRRWRRRSYKGRSPSVRRKWKRRVRGSIKRHRATRRRTKMCRSPRSIRRSKSYRKRRWGRRRWAIRGCRTRRTKSRRGRWWQKRRLAEEKTLLI